MVTASPHGGVPVESLRKLLEVPRNNCSSGSTFQLRTKSSEHFFRTGALRRMSSVTPCKFGKYAVRSGARRWSCTFRKAVSRLIEAAPRRGLLVSDIHDACGCYRHCCAVEHSRVAQWTSYLAQVSGSPPIALQRRRVFNAAVTDGSRSG